MRGHMHRTNIGEIQHMRPLIIRALGLLTAGALFIAACGGSAATTAPATSAPVTAAPATAAPLPTEVPGATTGPGASLDLSSFHGDQALEDKIPKNVGGEDLQILSMTGDQFLGSGADSPELAAALTALNKTTSDLSVAFAGNTKISIIAFRVQGVPAETLFNAFKDAETDAYTVETVTYGGKTVMNLIPSDGESALIYLKDDTMFVVGGSGAAAPTPEVLDEAFSKLP